MAKAAKKVDSKKDSDSKNSAHKQAKPKKTTAPKKAGGPKKMSQVAAAEKVLQEAGNPMDTQAMVDQMVAKGYWKSPKGKTPAATLYSTLLRDLKQQPKDRRFKKTGRGKFDLAK